MKIIVGLGNPGPQYETTRHNVGFLALDRLVDRWDASGPVRKYQGDLYQGKVRGEAVCLFKPQGYMNLSGKSVAPLFHFYHCKPNDLIVIYDDLDLAPLSLRFKTGGGTGGHNGLKSLDECLGKDNTGYHRIRIGIGRPEPGSPLSPSNYVLQQFKDEELQSLDPVLDDVAIAAEHILKGEIQAAMNRFHHKK